MNVHRPYHYLIEVEMLFSKDRRLKCNSRRYKEEENNEKHITTNKGSSTLKPKRKNTNNNKIV